MTSERISATAQPTRRDFLASAAATGAAVATGLGLASAVYADGGDTIKVGVIGCGGRGTQACENVLSSAPAVEVIAAGDVFPFRVNNLRKHLPKWLQSKDAEAARKHGNKVDLPEERCHTGLDAYEKVLATPGLNYVILATPPGFRPLCLEAAVAAGKNIFTEKPVAVDGPGIRKVLALFDEANKKNLRIAAGTQRRHQLGYLETMKHVHGGDIGDIVAGRCYWNQGRIWFRDRDQIDGLLGRKATDMEYQLHNWYHFVWLCGDHICEQHVHNLDVINWALGAHPVRALCSGGRATLPTGDANVVGHIFDHFTTDLEYPNGVHVLSMCRQIDGSDGNFQGQSGVSEALVGTRGTCQVNAYKINGKRVEIAGEETNPYVQEHTDLITCIRSGKPINELKNVAESTLTAIMCRMAGYTGKAVTWEAAMKSQQDTMPKGLTLETKHDIPAVATPGKTPLV
jgi:predicted dehydrogenase